MLATLTVPAHPQLLYRSLVDGPKGPHVGLEDGIHFNAIVEVLCGRFSNVITLLMIGQPECPNAASFQIAIAFCIRGSLRWSDSRPRLDGSNLDSSMDLNLLLGWRPV